MDRKCDAIFADIVDLTSSGCNDTHIWISWVWTTPMGCPVDKVVLNGEYYCFMEVCMYCDHLINLIH